jgi:hypothetical protein
MRDPATTSALTTHGPYLGAPQGGLGLASEATAGAITPPTVTAPGVADPGPGVGAHVPCRMSEARGIWWCVRCAEATLGDVLQLNP